MNDADDDGKKRHFVVFFCNEKIYTEIFLIIKYCLNDQRKFLIFCYMCRKNFIFKTMFFSSFNYCRLFNFCKKIL